MSVTKPLRRFAEMSKWERRLFCVGAFAVGIVMVLFRPDETALAMHKVLGQRLGKN